MSKIYKVAIVGGGAAGLFAADALSSRLGGEVVVLEKLNRVGKKIAVTGNGRGNFTNESLSSANYHSKEGDAFTFVLSALKRFDNAAAKKYLQSLGAMPVTENGRVYPASFQASSVLDLLRLRLDKNGAEIVTDFNVVKIEKRKNFVLTAENGDSVIAETVILSTGGKCQKQFGTDGNSYQLAKQMGHSVTECLPALVQLKTEMENIKQLKGVRQEVLLTLYDGTEPKTCEKGDLLFTEFGVSGNAVFGISGYVAASKQAELSVEFLPSFADYELAAVLLEKVDSSPYLLAEDLLTGIVNKQLGRVIVKRAGIDLNEKISRGHVKRVVKLLKDFRIKVIGTLGFNYAQVTRGGVRISECDDKTMQSKRVEGLYLVGELLDVDGDCGGYNLQWAFSSANLAVSDILLKSGLKRTNSGANI